MVGARAATGYGVHVAKELGAGLAERDFAVVSGAAYGIDGAAHEGALAVEGVTIAVLAGGVDRPYPAGHASLLERIRDAMAWWSARCRPARHRRGGGSSAATA